MSQTHTACGILRHSAHTHRRIANYACEPSENSRLKDVAGFSPELNILTLAAYKRACSRCDSVTLEGKQHSVVFLYSRAVSLRALRGECELDFAHEVQKASFRPHHKHKKQATARAAYFLWSKWRDSNSRPPVPEAIGSSLLTTFIYFLVLFSPKAMLSDALVRTVSTQSKSVDGQRCGHRANFARLKARKLNRIYPVLSFIFCR